MLSDRLSNLSADMDRKLVIVILAILSSYLLITSQVSINTEPRKNIEINPLGRVSAGATFELVILYFFLCKITIQIETLTTVDGCTYVYLDMGSNRGVQIR